LFDDLPNLFSVLESFQYHSWSFWTNTLKRKSHFVVAKVDFSGHQEINTSNNFQAPNNPFGYDQ